MLNTISKLIKVEISGIKNLDKKISLNILPNTIKNKKRIAKSNSVKAIYGTNGAGKTAIISALRLYKLVTTNYSCFTDEDNRDYAIKRINNKTKQFSIKLYYACGDSNEMKDVFSHEIVIDCNNEMPLIIKEELMEYKGETINTESKVLILIENGKIKTDNGIIQEDFLQFITKNAIALSGISSIISIFYNKFKFQEIESYIDNNADSSILNCLVRTWFLTQSMFVQLDSSDEFLKPFSISSKRLKELLDEKNENGSIYTLGSDIFEERIPRALLNSAKHVNEKYLKDFIKIFKPDLVGINLKSKKDKNTCIIKREYVYDDYSVDEDYESTGIKKLANLFKFLFMCSSCGSIVFIDEIDANINSIYLKKLIQFFVTYGNGQLIFTTHDIQNMNALESVKNGIDFINNNRELVSWKWDGNKNPCKKYSEGLIPGIPFNEEPFDFLNCLVWED